MLPGPGALPTARHRLLPPGSPPFSLQRSRRLTHPSLRPSRLLSMRQAVLMSLRSHPVLHLALGAGSLGSDGGLGSPLLGPRADPATAEGAAAAAEDAPGGIDIGRSNAEQLREPLLARQGPKTPSRLGMPPAPAQQLPITLLEDSPNASKGSSFASLVVILSKTIVGAGETCQHVSTAMHAHCAPLLLRCRTCPLPSSHRLTRLHLSPASQAPRRCHVRSSCWGCCWLEGFSCSWAT